MQIIKKDVRHIESFLNFFKLTENQHPKKLWIIPVTASNPQKFIIEYTRYCFKSTKIIIDPESSINKKLIRKLIRNIIK